MSIQYTLTDGCSPRPVYTQPVSIFYQACMNSVGWTVVDVDSESHPGTVYRVTISDFDYICDCKGFEFGGKCKHRAIAEQIRCKWAEGDDPCQSEVERKSFTCPLCGSPTVIVREGRI